MYTLSGIFIDPSDELRHGTDPFTLAIGSIATGTVSLHLGGQENSATVVVENCDRLIDELQRVRRAALVRAAGE